MRVLVGCEYSGIVRDAFAVRGHDAWSCDILDTEVPGNHIKGNVLKETQQLPDNISKRIWYLGSGKGHERSKFYTGIASAMAEQWGDESRLPIPVEQLNLFKG